MDRCGWKGVKDHCFKSLCSVPSQDFWISKVTEVLKQDISFVFQEDSFNVSMDDGLMMEEHN